jgi:hypothetical protein
MNYKITLFALGLTLTVVATLALAPIVSEMAFAKKGEANDHISSQGREHMSPNGAKHSGIGPLIFPPPPF